MFFFTPLAGVLFTFPSRYCFAIGHTLVFSLTRWSSLIHTEFHGLRATRDSVSELPFSTTGLSPPLVHLSNASSNFHSTSHCPTTPFTLVNGLGCFLFARRYWGNRCCFLFLQLLRCFSSLGSLASTYVFSRPSTRLPHSETSGSLLASSSPERIVGRHVLLRLCVPRYPPLALCSLTFYSL